MPLKKILLVNDSSTAWLVIRLMFSQKRNYVLLSAIDGKDALDRARAEKPDLILLDAIMPHMSGLEACRILKKQEQTSGIPVILLTACGQEHFAQEAFASGCNDLLAEPVTDTQMLDLFRAYLGE